MKRNEASGLFTMPSKLISTGDVIVRLERMIPHFPNSPINSGNDSISLAYYVADNA